MLYVIYFRLLYFIVFYFVSFLLQLLNLTSPFTGANYLLIQLFIVISYPPLLYLIRGPSIYSFVYYFSPPNHPLIFFFTHPSVSPSIYSKIHPSFHNFLHPSPQGVMQKVQQAKLFRQLLWRSKVASFC